MPSWRHNQTNATKQLSTRGGRQRLMDRPHRSDKEPESLMIKRPNVMRRSSQRDRESGQAMVEFALILFPLMLIVVAIIQFGIALNYWLDMQRIANQGARWAAVNNWPPDCPVGSGVGDCDGDPYPTLQESLVNQALTQGLENGVTVEICYPDGTGSQSHPVRVSLEAPFDLLPILGIGSLKLGADATMRLEQTPTLITGTVSC